MIDKELGEKALGAFIRQYDMTVRDFLRECLMKLWSEGEGFSGKRPLGNSSWYFHIIEALILAKVVEGRVEEDYGPIGYSDDEVDNAMKQAILALD